MQATQSIPRPALALGWLGVLPFAGLALAAVTGAILPAETATTALVQYGLIILSFMGGAQWGLAMQASRAGEAADGVRLGISVLPALAAFALSFLPADTALPSLAAAFAALLGYDVWTARRGLAPAWYPALRVQLTGAVVVTLLCASVFGLR